jgi:hypothetical protein
MREIRPRGFDEREVETEHGRRLLRHKRGNPETEVIRSLPHRATSRLYRFIFRAFPLPPDRARNRLRPNKLDNLEALRRHCRYMRMGSDARNCSVV